MMKKTIFLVAMIAAIWSCNSNDSSSNDATGNNGAGTGTGPAAGSSTENRPATAGSSGTDANAAKPAGGDITQNPDYQKGIALISKSDCLGCHKVSEKLVGPAYQEVAGRYAGKPGIEDSLANKIIHGGAGNWGQVPMSPHPQVSHDDAVAMAKYILLLKQ